MDWLCLRKRFAAVWLIAAGFCQQAAICGAEYELEGTIAFTHDDSRADVYNRDFRVSVRDCGWLIKTVELKTSANPGVVHYVGSTNGVEVFQLSYWTNGMVTGSVESNSVPVDGVDKVAPYLWISLASRCYFERAEDGLAKPAFDGSAGVRGLNFLEVRADWALQEAPPYGLDKVSITPRIRILKNASPTLFSRSPSVCA